MARIRPFRAWTYARSSADITTLVAPPYDVIPPQQREELLAKNEHNVVALELPEGSLDPSVANNRYETGAARWKQWREDATLRRDEIPALYVLEQRYELDGTPVSRKAFITEVELHAFSEGVVLPHERTLPKALDDRLSLTRACAANFSQVFGLYSDTARVTDAIFATAMADEPTMTATDGDNVTSTVWAVTDPALIEQAIDALAPERIFIADGHHRYTTALAYRDERRAADAESGLTPDDPDYNFILMALVNMDDPDLVVLPTHRVADAPGEFDPQAFYQALTPYFDLSDLPGSTPVSRPAQALEGHARPAFLVQTRGDERPRLAVLRADIDLDTTITAERSRAWKELDVAVLLELILSPLLDIHPDRPETLERLLFVKDPHKALKMAEEHDVAFVLRATEMEQMRAVSITGDMMPQKSTYFYPKLLSGLVLRSMD